MTVETDELGPGWNAIEPPSKGGGKRQDSGISLFMKLDPRPQPYHFRLACTPITFRKHKWAFRQLRQWPISPASDRSEKDLDIAWTEGNFMPVSRYAALVFDRDNENRLRILEEGQEVFGPIYNQGKVSNINPASPTKGWDWVAIVSEEKTFQNGKERKSRKYSVSPDLSKNGPTPLTTEELTALENPKFQREELSSRYFAKSTPEEIKDLWEQLPMSARKNEMSDKFNTDAKSNAKTDSTSASKTVTQPATSKAAVQKEPLVEPPVERPVAKQASVPTQKVEPAPADVEDDGFLADPVDSDDEEAARFF